MPKLKKWRQRRPKDWATDCKDRMRPCPWFGCKWNMLLDVSDAGSIIFNLPERGRQKITVPNVRSKKANATFDRLETKLIDEMERRHDEGIETCAKDVFEQGKVVTLADIGVMMALTRERVRQLELDGKDESHDSEELREEREIRGLPERSSKRGSSSKTKSVKAAAKKKTRAKRRNRQKRDHD